MKTTVLKKGAIALLIIAAATGGAFAQTAPTRLPMDEESVINGVEAACTGIAESKLEARWQRYPIRIEFADARAEYLIGAAVTVRNAKGGEVLSVTCSGPWVLLRLPKGTYSVEARILDSSAKPRTGKFTPPAKGQTRVVLRFPDA